MNRFTWRLLVVVLLNASSGITSVEAQLPILDLTNVQAGSRATLVEPTGSAIEIGRAEEVRGGGSSGPPVARLPFALAIKTLTPNVCLWGEEIVYEISLKNTGTDIVFLPWSREEFVSADHEEARRHQQMTVALILDDGTAAGDLLGTVGTALGSQVLPGSLQPLAPGQEARIRASTKCRPQIPTDEQSRLLKSLPRPTSVYARVILRGRPKGAPPTVMNSSHAELTILPR